MSGGKDKWHESVRGLITDLLDRLPGWPNERLLIIFMTWGLGSGMLILARDNPELWKEELYKTILTVVLVTGFTNMILAFYFSANSGEAQGRESIGKLADAAKTTALTARDIQRAATGDGGNGNDGGEGGTHIETPSQQVDLAPGESARVEAKGD